MNKPIYKRIPPKLDRRRKLMPEDYIVIKKLYKKGMSQSAIARKYGVSQGTIWRIVTPGMIEHYNKRKNQWNKHRYKTDPEYKNKQRKLSNQSHSYKRKVCPEEFEYDAKISVLRKNRIKQETGTTYEESHRRYYQKKKAAMDK